MKSKCEIEMDFERAMAQAQELEEISDELSKIASAHVADAFEMLAKNWQGDNSKNFLKKSSGLTTDMIETADDLLKIARNIRTTAGIVYKAESMARQIAY